MAVDKDMHLPGVASPPMCLRQIVVAGLRCGSLSLHCCRPRCFYNGGDSLRFFVPWQVVGLVDAVVEEAAAFLSATSATLFILDREDGILWARRRGLPGTPDAGALQVTRSA